MSISKRNRRGLWVLIIACITLSYIPRVLAGLHDSELNYSYIELQEAEEVVAEQKKSVEKKRYVKKKKSWKAPASKFDPNEYSREDWMQLGLSQKQADVILKFTSRGIYSNDDLKKIFVLPPELFELLKDSTYYPEKEVASKPKFEKKELVIVDLNTASLEELKSLPGIGDYYAEKIVSYREELGGYIGTHQLLDLWKFGTERYDKLSDRIVVEGSVNKININTADIEQLKAHPYISYKVANSIVKMRNAHGSYKSLHDLTRSELINEELFKKIQPYLTL